MIRELAVIFICRFISYSYWAGAIMCGGHMAHTRHVILTRHPPLCAALVGLYLDWFVWEPSIGFGWTHTYHEKNEKKFQNYHCY